MPNDKTQEGLQARFEGSGDVVGQRRREVDGQVRGLCDGEANDTRPEQRNDLQ